MFGGKELEKLINMHQHQLIASSLFTKSQNIYDKNKNKNLDLFDERRQDLKEKNLKSIMQTEESIKNGSSNTFINKYIINKINSPIQKTNLDYFIDYSSNPFTTKFEMIGSNHNNGNTYKWHKSQSILNLNNKSIENNNISPIKPFKNDEINNKEYIKENIYNKKSINQKIIDHNEFTNLSKISEENITNTINITKNEANDSYCLKNFLRVTDSLYISSVKSITNERKMCKLNIEYLVDITNMRPEDFNRQSISKLPCLCKKQHSRINLSIEINDTSFKTLFNSFSEVNKFILRARKSSRRVLIIGKDDFSSIVKCACLQYLMVEYELTLKDAIDGLSEISSAKLILDSCYLDYLQKFEIYLNHMMSNLYGSQYFKSISDNKQSKNNEIDITTVEEKSVLNENILTRKNRNSLSFKMAWM